MTAQALANAAYVVAALLFVMSLAGLSKHETGRTGIRYGIAGMTIAIAVTVWLSLSGSWTDSTLAWRWAFGCCIELLEQLLVYGEQR
jgi:H+-translocating NAD(P) transhydrogenase subunit beta